MRSRRETEATAIVRQVSVNVDDPVGERARKTGANGVDGGKGILVSNNVGGAGNGEGVGQRGAAEIAIDQSRDDADFC